MGGITNVANVVLGSAASAYDFTANGIPGLVIDARAAEPTRYGPVCGEAGYIKYLQAALRVT